MSNTATAVSTEDMIKRIESLSILSFMADQWDNDADKAEFLSDLETMDPATVKEKYTHLEATFDAKMGNAAIYNAPVAGVIYLDAIDPQKQDLVTEIMEMIERPAVWEDVKTQFAGLAQNPSPALSDNATNAPTIPDITPDLVETYLQGFDTAQLENTKAVITENYLPKAEEDIAEQTLETTPPDEGITHNPAEPSALSTQAESDAPCFIENEVKLYDSEIHQFNQEQDVRSIQIAIAALGQEGIKDDGSFGTKTSRGLEAALTDIQAKNGIPQTGDYNAETAAALESTIANLGDSAPNTALSYELLKSGLDNMQDNQLEVGISALDLVYNDYSRNPPIEPCDPIASLPNNTEHRQSMSI